MFAYLTQNVDRFATRPLSASTKLAADLHLDSLEGAELLSAMEDQLDLTIPISVLQRAETLGDVANLVVSAFQASRKG